MERYAAALDAGGVGVWEWRFHEDALLADLNARQCLRLPAQQSAPTAIGAWLAAVHPDDRARVANALHRATERADGRFISEHRLVDSSGGIATVRAAAAMRQSPNRAARLVGTVCDCSIAARQRSRLQQALAKAERDRAANLMFLANLSHEMRSPLNGVIGLASLLVDIQELSPDQRQCVEVIQSSGRALLALVDDILDLSRAEAGKLELDRTDFDLFQLIDDLAASLALPAYRKGVELACIVQPDVPGWLRGDPQRLRQALTNLVSNAIKFTDAGAVAVTVDLVKRNEDSAVLRFSVVDTGIGIPEELQPNLFQAFVQGDASTSRIRGGSGLGLAICKRLVDLMGGAIGVRSRPGEGAEFWFEALFSLPPHSFEERPPLARESAWILVVEGSEPVRQQLHCHLQRLGLRTMLCGSQAEALEAFSDALAQGRSVAACLIAKSLPDGSGAGLAERIRSTAAAAQEATCVQLTPMHQLGHHEGGVEAAFEATLAKPVSRTDLDRLLYQILQ